MKQIKQKDPLGINITNNLTVSPITSSFKRKITRWYKCPECGNILKEIKKERDFL